MKRCCWTPSRHQAPARGVLRIALWVGTLVAPVALGCGSAAPQPLSSLAITLETPRAPDPFFELSTLRATVSGPGIDAIVSQIALPARALELPEIPYGKERTITLVGLDQSGRERARGRTRPFELSAASPATLSLYFAQVGRFSTSKLRLATARYGHSASRLPDGRIWVAGGFDSTMSATGAVEIYDPASGTIDRGPPLRQPRGGHLALVAGKYLLLLGGSNAPSAADTVAIVDTETGTSGELSLTTPRSGYASAVLADGRVALIGGRNDKGHTIDLTEVIDPVASRVTPGPNGNAVVEGAIAGLLADGSVALLGGFRDPPGVASTAIYLLDPNATRWDRSALTLPKGRIGARVIESAGQLLIIGGRDESGALDRSVWLFDGARLAVLGSTEQDFVAFGATALSEGALVAGGTGGAGVALYFDGSLKSAGSLNAARADFALAPLPDGSALALGGRDQGKVLDGIERFVLP